MRVINSYIFRAVCALIVGILLVANPEGMTTLLVQVIGGLFIVSGLVSVINYFVVRYSKDAVLKPFFPVVGVGSLLFGVFLGFFPVLFIHYLMFVLGGLMVLAGFSQLWSMFRYRRVVPFRWYVFLTAVLILFLGVFIVFNPLQSASVPFIIIGATFIIYGLAELVNGVRLRKYNKMSQEIQIIVEDAEVKE